MTYKEQLADPRWQKKRLQIFERDKFTCQICLDTKTQLHVHHNYYDKTYQTLAWEYPENAYRTLCSDCHKSLTAHINEHGNDNEFDLMKIARNGKPNFLFVYSKGMLHLDSQEEEIQTITISENTTYKVVQFLINNWLKNG